MSDFTFDRGYIQIKLNPGGYSPPEMVRAALDHQDYINERVDWGMLANKVNDMALYGTSTINTEDLIK